VKIFRLTVLRGWKWLKRKGIRSAPTLGTVVWLSVAIQEDVLLSLGISGATVIGWIWKSGKYIEKIEGLERTVQELGKNISHLNENVLFEKDTKPFYDKLNDLLAEFRAFRTEYYNNVNRTKGS
jgi:hypothetical protein